MWILHDNVLRGSVGFNVSCEYCENESHVQCEFKVGMQVLHGWVLGQMC